MRYVLALAAFIACQHVFAACPGLAGADIAGNCRNNPPTPGALEVAPGTVTPATPTPAPTPTPVPAPTPAPSTTNVYTLPAVYTADIFSTGGRGADNPWDHCIGRQGPVVCRFVVKFDTATLPKNKTITSLKLRLAVTYVSPNIGVTTWAVGRYAGDPKSDDDATAFVRAAPWTPWIKGSRLLRTVGVKTVTLTGTAAVADLVAAVAAGLPFVVAIRANDERTPDRFVAVGKAPELLVTVK